MIFTEKKIIINNNQCKIDSPVVLYRGDYNVEVRFTIVSSPYKYSNKQETNIIEQTEASYGQLVIKTPNTNAPIFSEITTTKRGAITFTITAEMIDEISEVGDYTFQIRLLDENKESRATIPEVKNGIEIREPIASEDVTTTNQVDLATVGYAVTTEGETLDAFDEHGNYNKTTWATGDRITAAKLDKIEAGIDGVNRKVSNVDLSNYVTKEQGNANQITFSDGQTLQAKLDTGTLKGDKGDKGDVGPQGPQGIQGPAGTTTASGVSITDTANNFTATDVEGALQEVGSQIKDKVSKGEGGVITNAMLSQEVKEAMTGGSVAVVGKNTVLEENIVDGQVTKRKTSFYKKSINLCDRDLFVAGKGIIGNNGQLYDNPDLSAFEEYVPIDCDFISYERFTLDGISDSPDNSAIGVAFYDTNKAWISFSDIRSREYIQVPSGAKYIRLHIPSVRLVNSNINVLPKKEITGTYLKPYEFEETSEINKELAKLKDGSFIQDGIIKPNKTTFFNVYKNLFDVSKIVVGAILKEAGVLATEFDQWKATDWIEVKGGTTVYFSKDGEPYAIHLGALYDINKNYLSGMNDTNSVKVSQDGYIRVSQNGGFPDKFQIEVGQVTKYKEFGIEEFVLKQEYLGNIMDNIGNKYEGKNYLLLGDSITALGNNPYGWEYHFRNIMKPKKVVNISVNGCSWKDKVDTPAYDGNPTPENNLNVIGNQVQKVINQKAAGNVDYDNFDVIIIACGTNDDYDLNNPETDESIESEFVTGYGANNFAVKPLESVNRKTFAGIMRYTYEKLYELYPNAVFFVTTPLQEVYESYKSIKAKGDLIDAVADRLSINTINTRRCGILNLYESPVGDIDYDNPTGSESMRKRDLSDGIHTNASGAKKLGEFIARDIINYFNF